MNWESTVQRLIEAVLFGGIGIVLFVIVFKAIVRSAPFSIRKEIEEDQNSALAILVGHDSLDELGGVRAAGADHGHLHAHAGASPSTTPSS